MAEHRKNLVLSPLELKGLSKYLSLNFHRLLARAVWTFCKLDIADLMVAHAAPMTAVELSKLNGNNWNAEFLYRLLRVIADVGIVRPVIRKKENLRGSIQPEEMIRFELTEDGMFLTHNHYSKVRDMVLLDLGPVTEKLSTNLPSLIRSGDENGNSFEQTLGCSLFDYMQKEENKEYANLFNNSMLAYSTYITSSIVSMIDFTRFGVIVDVAGGLGTVLASILEKNRKIRGVLFDLEHVIANTKETHPNEFQRKQIDPSRYELVSGDMFKPETIPSGDAYVLQFIIHDWSDDKSIEILKAIRRANRFRTRNKTTVFLVEMVILSDDKDNWETHVVDLEMLSSVGSRERTLHEYVSLLHESGFKLTQLYKTRGFMSVIEAVATSQEADSSS